MLGTQIKKDNFDAELYAKCAEFCNVNGMRMVEHDSYYEVEEITISEPTLQQKAAEINSYYNSRFDVIKSAILDRQMAGKPYSDLQEQYTKLAAERIAKLKELKGAK
jgi:hypothetical protein